MVCNRKAFNGAFMQIQIRPFKTSDAHRLQHTVLGSAGHIGRWLDWCTPRYTLQDARDWVSDSITLWEEGIAFRWVIVSADAADHFLGSVEINHPVLGEPIGRMGYWVRRQSVGQGVCTGAAAQALHWVFNQRGLQRVEFLIHPTNEASIGVARHLGASFEGVSNNAIYNFGESSPANCYSVTLDKLNMTCIPSERRRDPLMQKQAWEAGKNAPQISVKF